MAKELNPKLGSILLEQNGTEIAAFRLTLQAGIVATQAGPGTAAIGVGGPALLPSATRTVYVSKAGDDQTGNGTFDAPFLTIQRAMNSITDNSQTKVYEIDVGPGTYVDSILIKPWVGITGRPTTSAFEGLVTIDVSSISFDPSWVGNVFNVAWLSHLTFANKPVFDFHQFAGINGQLTFFDCLFNAGATYIGTQPGNVNNINWDDCLSYDVVTIQDCQFFFLTGGSLIQITQGGPALDVTSTVEATTVLALSGAINGDINLHTAGANPIVTAELIGCAVHGSLTLDGHVAYQSTVAGVPPTITLLNGAPPPVLLTFANGLGYTPAVAGNWNNTAPKNVSDALDRIAAHLGPIP